MKGKGDSERERNRAIVNDKEGQKVVQRRRRRNSDPFGFNGWLERLYIMYGPRRRRRRRA